MKVLHIDSSIAGGASVSRQLTAGIVKRLEEQAADLAVVYRDVVVELVPQQSTALHFAKLKLLNDAAMLPDASKDAFDAAVAAGATLDEVGQRELQGARAVLEEFLNADVVVIGAPMYNFGIPSQLKAWIDCLFVPGKTFTYTASGPKGLVSGKKIVIASSRGGIHSSPSPTASMDHQESYLTTCFRFLGVTDVSFVRAEGLGISTEHRLRAISTAQAEIVNLTAA